MIQAAPLHNAVTNTSIAHRCNICAGGNHTPYIELPAMPVAHHMPRSTDTEEYTHPFCMVRCEDCGLLQLANPVPPEKLYSDVDAYLTGFQKPRHLEDLIATAICYQDPQRVLDIGCNDGSLLQVLKEQGYTTLVGLEPNKAAVKAARAKGYNVYEGLLDTGMVTQILAEQGQFDTVYLRHVAEHVSDLPGFFTQLRRILINGGLLICELPQIEPGLAQGNPAFLWEEHVSYFTEGMARTMLERFGYDILDSKHYVFGGGSIAFVARQLPNMPSMTPQKMRVHDPLVEEFPVKLARYQTQLQRLVENAKNQSYTIAIYGAAPRSCILANGCAIASMIDYVIDDRADIQDRFLPGTKKPVQARGRVLPHCGEKLLCLLGVGADKEYIVKRKLESEYKGELLCVSLFPQRDTVASLKQALELLES